MIFNDIFCQDVRAPAPAINQAAGLISIIPTSPQRGLLLGPGPGLQIHSVPNQIPISTWTDGMIARDGPDAIQDTHYRWGGLGLSWNWTQPGHTGSM